MAKVNNSIMSSIIRSLKLTPGEYTVFGSGTLVALGIIEFVEDIDIVTSLEEYRKLKTIYTEFKPDGLICEHDECRIEIFSSWMGMNVNTIIKNSIIIEGISFASLADIKYFKGILKRPKDIEHIEKIDSYLLQRNK